MDKDLHNNLLLNIIIPALEGYVQERQDGLKQVIVEDEKQDKGKFSYLLGQAIRHWIIPVGNWHTSEAAMMVWNMIVDKGNSKHKEINHIRYKEPILIKDDNIMIPRFKGSTRDFAKLDPHIFHGGKQYAFNEIFVAEHTTPVVDIMIAMTQCYDELDNQHKLDDVILKQEVEKILNKIHITQMLRIEDRRIKTTQARIQPFLYKKNMNSVYHYLVDSNNDVYKDIWQSYYRELEGNNVKNSSKKKYNKILKKIEEAYHLEIPEWARAINIHRPYTINIHPNNPKQ